MKRNYKKISALLASLCVMTGSVSGLTVNASTNPTPITNFSVPANISHVYNPLPSYQNPIRFKDTSNPVYLKLTSNTKGAFVQVWGLRDTNWNSKCENVTLNNELQPVSSVYVGTKTYRIHSNVYEGGYPLCGLKFCSGSYTEYSVLDGEWAPD